MERIRALPAQKVNRPMGPVFYICMGSLRRTAYPEYR